MASGKGVRFLEELKGEFCVKKFGLSHEDPSLFVRAQCFNPVIYLVWSGFWALFFSSMQLLGIYYNVDAGPYYFIYLTNLTYLLQNVTLLVDFAVTLYIYLKRPDIIDGKSDEMAWYFKVLWVLFTVTNTSSVLVTGMYYGLLTPVFKHDSVNKHLINGLHSLINILFCAKPVNVLHVYQPMIYAILYILFSVIYHLAGGDPIYDPLDWSDTGRTIILTVIVLFVACPAIHIFIFYSLYTVRLFVFQRCCVPRVEAEPEVIERREFTIDSGEEVEFYRSKSAHDETMLRY